MLSRCSLSGNAIPNSRCQQSGPKLACTRPLPRNSLEAFGKPQTASRRGTGVESEALSTIRRKPSRRADWFSSEVAFHNLEPSRLVTGIGPVIAIVIGGATSSGGERTDVRAGRCRGEHGRLQRGVSRSVNREGAEPIG